VHLQITLKAPIRQGGTNTKFQGEYAELEFGIPCLKRRQKLNFLRISNLITNSK
jgi:hypothetical protein